MTTVYLATERLKKALTTEPNIDPNLARHSIRFLNAFERGNISHNIPELTSAVIGRLFLNFAKYCPKDLKDPGPDLKAEEWVKRNEWFGKDDAMTWAAFGIHKQLIEEEDYDAQSDSYYTEIDKRMKEAFPHKFD